MGERTRRGTLRRNLVMMTVGIGTLLLPAFGTAPAKGVANPFHAKSVTVSFPASGTVKVSVAVSATNSGIAEAQTGKGFVGEFVHLEKTGTSTVSFASPDGVTGADGTYTTTYTGSGSFDAKSCNRPPPLNSYCVTTSASA